MSTLQIIAGFRMAMGDEGVTMPMLDELRDAFDEWLVSTGGDAEDEDPAKAQQREMLAAMGIE